MIVPILDWLCIGNYRATKALSLLVSQHIEAMLELAELVRQPQIETLYLDVTDGEPIPPDLLRQGVEFTRQQHAQGRRVLIACGAGISRSVAFTMAVLKEEKALSLMEAFRLIHEQHHMAMPHPALWRSMCAYYPDEPPYEDIWHDVITLKD